MPKVITKVPPDPSPGAPRLLALKVTYQGTEREVAIIPKPLGRDFLEIGKEMNGDPARYYPCAMRVLLRLATPENEKQPWRKLAYQEWEELAYFDFAAVMEKLIEEGFQLGG
jgi:hypothetical protein